MKLEHKGGPKLKEKTEMIFGGKITKMEGMNIEDDGCWEYQQPDPHLYIRLDVPVCKIRIAYEMEEAMMDVSDEHMTVYYSKDGEDYSEDRTVKSWVQSDKGVQLDIQWETPVRSIRLDPVECTGKCKFRYFTLEALADLEDQNEKEKVIVLTHELSETGAPILACNIARKMKENGKGVTVLSLFPGNGYLESRYRESKIPLICLGSHPHAEQKWIRIDQKGEQKELTSEEHFAQEIKKLQKNGYHTVIANTVVSGICMKKLKECGFKIISLIHEMKTTIEYYGFVTPGKNVAKYADYVVFPNEFVRNDFKNVFGKISGKPFIHPQGVYLKKCEEERPEVLKKYQLDEKEYVMSSGTAELRKGVDLFVDAAIVLLNKKADIHFVWTGEFQNKELECWMKDQIRRSGFEENFHFVRFVKDSEEYGQILKNAKAFWGLSREDPFPSTVLEAMNNEVPVIGFACTGGIHVMLSEGRGILVDHFDLKQVVEKTCKILDGKNLKKKHMTAKARRYVQGLNFENYVAFLEECVNRVEN